MRHAARYADRIISTQNESRAPYLEFWIGEYLLDAIFAHDPITGFRDNQINAMCRQLIEDHSRNACRRFRSSAGGPGVGEIQDRVSSVVAHRKNVAQQADAGELGAAYAISFLRKAAYQRTRGMGFAGLHASTRNKNNRHPPRIHMPADYAVEDRRRRADAGTKFLEK